MTSGALPLPRDGAAREGAPGMLHALRGGVPATALGTLADDRLLALARNGDRGAFGELVTRHHGMLHGLLRQRLGPGGPVDDLLQDVFAKALSKLDGFHGRSTFSTWAGAIALNLATDWQRKRTRRNRLAPPAGIAGDEVPAPRAASGLAEVETREEADRARRALESLPLRVRIAITLRVVEDLPYEAVATRLDAPVATVRTWVSRGLRRVRELLEVQDA